MKTKRGMQTRIADFCKRISKKADMDCLIDFEDKDWRTFYFKYDGFIYDCIHYNGEFYKYHGENFHKLFEKSGWNWGRESASVIVVYKEGESMKLDLNEEGD